MVIGKIGVRVAIACLGPCCRFGFAVTIDQVHDGDQRLYGTFQLVAGEAVQVRQQGHLRGAGGHDAGYSGRHVTPPPVCGLRR
ncbi:MAG: hypothetical protein AB7G25_04630 [Sphingomonadaceae bacterium]